MNHLVFISVAAVLLAGCSHAMNGRGLHEGRDLPRESCPASVATTNSLPAHANGNDAALVDVELTPELSAVLKGGQDVSVDLIEVSQLQTWQVRAEVRLRLEIQRGKLDYLNQLMRLAEQSEEEFFQKFDIQNVAAGDITGCHLRMFRLIRSRIEGELKDTKASIAQLETLLRQLPLTPATS